MKNVPEEHVSGKLPESLTAICLEAMCCVGFMLTLFFVTLFVCLCIVLNATNNPEVKAECSGFWEFMVVALLSPITFPVMFLLVVGRVSWSVFSGTCCLVFGIVSLHMSIAMAEKTECVEALRRSTPPVPWLLYAVWLKTILFFSQCIYAARGLFSANAVRVGSGSVL